MVPAHDFLFTLAVVLCVAALTTVACHRLRLPVVFGYLVAGMIVGPHLPIPLVADEATVRTLSELGVILLMYSLGLEFRLRRLRQVGAISGLAAVAESSAMLALGYLAGALLGWSQAERLFAGAMVAISSTTIVTKTFDERGVSGRLRDLVVGVLLCEDLIAIVLIALLTAVAAGASLESGSLGLVVVRLATFLVGQVAIGLLIVPRLVRAVVRFDRAETTLVTAVGICFAYALLALAFGYSVALGAFIAGSLVAESGEAAGIERLVHPLRDLFVAIFFVSVGMQLDPVLLVPLWPVILLFTGLVIAGKIAAVTAGAFLSGSGLRTAVQAGMSLAQIGEFSFVIAAIGVASGATRSTLYQVAVAVSAITTLVAPWLIGAADPVALWIDRRLPRRLQLFVALYGSWMERMRGAAPAAERSRTTLLTRLLLLDIAVIAGVVIGAAAEQGRVTTLIARWTPFDERLARAIVIGGAIAVAVPLSLGVVRTSRQLSVLLASRALPPATLGRLDFAAAPRRTLTLTLHLTVLLLVAILLVSVTQPFVPAYRGTILLAILALLIGVFFWQSVRDLQQHAQAGAEVIVMAIAQQLARSHEPTDITQTMARVGTMLPGLGEPVSLAIGAADHAAGRTLAELNLRGLTGATVLAITRSEGSGEQLLSPRGRDRILAGDVLALAGTHDAVHAASQLLVGG